MRRIDKFKLPPRCLVGQHRNIFDIRFLLVPLSCTMFLDWCYDNVPPSPPPSLPPSVPITLYIMFILLDN